MQKSIRNILLGIGAFFLFVVVIPLFIAISTYVKWHDYANTTETQLTTTLQNNTAIRSEYYNKIQELVQLPAMYADDLKKVYNGAIEGRYGVNGSQATVQFIHEANPNLDPDMYKQIMRVMEAGRNEFANNQTRLMDMKAIYVTNLGNVWSGFWIHLTGYPKIDLNSIKTINTEKANSELETGISTPLQLRPTETK